MCGPFFCFMQDIPAVTKKTENGIWFSVFRRGHFDKLSDR